MNSSVDQLGENRTYKWWSVSLTAERKKDTAAFDGRPISYMVEQAEAKVEVGGQ